VNSVGGNIANVNSVAGNATNINAVNANATNINTVAGINANVTTVAGISANVTTVAGISGNVTSVAGNASNINQVASDTVAINSASANATTATTKAAEALASANAASASAAAASAVALGDEPIRHSVRPSLLLDFANTKTLDPRITFTRASTGTFYDGKTVAKAEENLHANSQSLTATFVLSGGTGSLTANATTAPDGTTTAASLVPANGATALAYYGNTVIPSANSYTISIFAKANGMNFIAIGTNNSAAVVEANLSTGAISSGTGSIVSVGNDWYRITAQASSYSNTVYYLQVRDTSGTATLSTSNGTNGVYVWGAQIEQRSFGTAYTATSGSPITNYIPALQTAASGVARFEHNPVTGESLGLEIEEQRVNLALRSEEFDNASWTKVRASITSNTIVAPDGTLTGDKLVGTTDSDTHIVFQGSISYTSGTVYTATVYAKAGEQNAIAFYFPNSFGFSANTGIYVDLTTGQAVTGTSITLTAPTSSSITSVGNGWYRISITQAASSTTASGRSAYITSATGTTNAFAGDGYSGIYIWGAQLEAGSFATSYIPTVASQVTRVADSASMTGTNFSSWYNFEQGTLFASFTNLGRSSVDKEVVSIGSGTSARISFLQSNFGVTNSIGFSSPGSYVASVTGRGLAGVSVVAAGGYSKTIPSSYYTNGVVSTSVPSLDSSAGNSSSLPDTLNIGTRFANSEKYTGTVRKIAFYSKRLTDAELQGVTTV
jgi:hypothetical protein